MEKGERQRREKKVSSLLSSYREGCFILFLAALANEMLRFYS